MSGNGSSGSDGVGSKQAGSSGFSIDSEKSIQLEVPSITKLLDRKKLEISSPGNKATVRPKGAGDRRSDYRLQTLPEAPTAPARPQSSEDLARKLRQAISASWVVVLAADGTHFKAHSVLGGDRNIWSLFTGFAIGPEHSPSLFSALAQARVVELTTVSGASDAQALRSALALEDSSGLVVVAAGSGVVIPFLMLAAFPNSTGSAVASRLAVLLKELAAAKL